MLECLPISGLKNTEEKQGSQEKIHMNRNYETMDTVNRKGGKEQEVQVRHENGAVGICEVSAPHTLEEVAIPVHHMNVMNVLMNVSLTGIVIDFGTLTASQVTEKVCGVSEVCVVKHGLGSTEKGSSHMKNVIMRDIWRTIQLSDHVATVQHQVNTVTKVVAQCGMVAVAVQAP